MTRPGIRSKKVPTRLNHKPKTRWLQRVQPFGWYQQTQKWFFSMLTSRFCVDFTNLEIAWPQSQNYLFFRERGTKVWISHSEAFAKEIFMPVFCVFRHHNTNDVWCYLCESKLKINTTNHQMKWHFFISHSSTLQRLLQKLRWAKSSCIDLDLVYL